jgi:hypothetical protein
MANLAECMVYQKWLQHRYVQALGIRLAFPDG